MGIGADQEKAKLYVEEQGMKHKKGLVGQVGEEYVE